MADDKKPGEAKYIGDQAIVDGVDKILKDYAEKFKEKYQPFSKETALRFFDDVKAVGRNAIVLHNDLKGVDKYLVDAVEKLEKDIKKQLASAKSGANRRNLAIASLEAAEEAFTKANSRKPKNPFSEMEVKDRDNETFA